MLISNNPSNEKIAEIIATSTEKAAKWIKDLETNDFWYWPAEKAIHAQMASLLSIPRYEKGLAVNEKS